MINSKISFEIPFFLTQIIETRLKQLGTSLAESEFLAKQIQQLSDLYIENPKGKTPDFHSHKWSEIASLVYYFPLNYLRNLKVFQEAQRLGFMQELNSVIEFGAGLGPSSWAIQSLADGTTTNHLWIERLEGSKNYAELFKKHFSSRISKFELQQQINENFSNDILPQKTLAVFSYSLTELDHLPKWADQLEALAIIEPSTQEDGRRLQELRPQLIEKGFSIWAPCLHELECPLLKHSKKDWCHDRLLFQRPSWLEKIETHLPWENKSLTFSYILARKTSPPWKGKSFPNTARIIGDTLYEKGKTRQMICKNDERLFLAWLNKNTTAPELSRGSLVTWSEHESKSNEIRPRGPTKFSPTLK